MLKVSLRRQRRLWQREGTLYYGPADFVLQHGRVYDHWVDPPKQMVPNMCFGNAVVLAAKFNLKYVEGYALSPVGQTVHHAWNSNEAGDLIDSTWPLGQGLAYLGVEFSVERADDCTWNGDACVLDDSKRDYPLLKQRWQGEPRGLVWPASRRLDALRAGEDETLLEELLKENPDLLDV